MRFLSALALFLVGTRAFAGQKAIPPGTIIPITLNRSLDGARARPGQAIRATIMQDIPGTEIHRRATIVGHIVQAPATGIGQWKLAFTFDFASVHGKLIHLQTSLRAIASFLEVQEAQIPEDMGDFSMTPETWNTQQIGGEQFYRSGGPVADGVTTVGKTTPWGALALPRTQAGQPCHGIIGENSQPQAMWWFSSNACGVYGFSSLHIQHAGRSNPAGIIILSSSEKLKLGSGTAFLLRVW